MLNQARQADLVMDEVFKDKTFGIIVTAMANQNTNSKSNLFFHFFNTRLMKIKAKKPQAVFQKFEIKKERLKHLKGGDDIVIEDYVDG